MKKPEMILFDYGHTLLYEPGFDAARCEAAFDYLHIYDWDELIGILSNKEP